MRFVFKLIAAPFLLALTILVALFSFIVSVSDVILGILSGLMIIAALIMFVTGQPTGGIVFLAVGFLVSPYGLPALARGLVKILGSLKLGLKGFILG